MNCIIVVQHVQHLKTLANEKTRCNCWNVICERVLSQTALNANSWPCQRHLSARQYGWLCECIRLRWDCLLIWQYRSICKLLSINNSCSDLLLFKQTSSHMPVLTGKLSIEWNRLLWAEVTAKFYFAKLPSNDIWQIGVPINEAYWVGSVQKVMTQIHN